jgi:hypothetical protein
MILEPAWICYYYLGMNWTESYNLPVIYKRFMIERTVQELNKSSDQGATTSKSIQANSPDVRSLQGRQRSQVPAKLRRFT